MYTFCIIKHFFTIFDEYVKIYLIKLTNEENVCIVFIVEKKLQIIVDSVAIVAKRYIITLNELIFYKVLLEIAKELNLILLCQVSLYSIIQTKNKNDAYFNKIRSKSIDFVLVRQADCKIKLCIELDDSTHNYQNRIERDKFINSLFQDLNINLLRVKSKSVYNKESIKQKILQYIGE